MSIYEDIKKAVQDLLAPDIHEIKGEMKAINMRLDLIDRRFSDLIERLELTKRVERLEQQQKESRQ